MILTKKKRLFSLEMKLAIWSPRRNVARQLTITTDQAVGFSFFLLCPTLFLW